MKHLIYQWHFEPLVVLLAMGIVGFYYYISDFKRLKNSIVFWTAIFLFLIAECSPLHYLGMHYYFSAHMITHVILLLICGPLLVMSLRPKRSSPALKSMELLSAFLYRHSWLGWIAGVGVMWFWHIPAVFNASAEYSHTSFGFIPLLHAGSMLLAGILFSWPLFNPLPKYHIHPLAGIMYLFTACISCSLLGLLITFAPLTTYHHYPGASMQMTTVNPWGISPRADQQAAGLIMWVPCCFVYLAGCIYLLLRWFSGNAAPQNNELIKLNTSISNHA